MATLKATTYTELDRLLAGDFERVIGNNTRCHCDGDVFVITLHRNEIVRVHPDHVEFTLAGWNTVTTRERVNQFLPRGASVNTHDYVAHLSRWDADAEHGYREGEAESISSDQWYTVD